MTPPSGGGDDDGWVFAPHARRALVAMALNERYEMDVHAWRGVYHATAVIVNPKVNVGRYVALLLRELQSDPGLRPRFQA